MTADLNYVSEHLKALHTSLDSVSNDLHNNLEMLALDLHLITGDSMESCREFASHFPPDYLTAKIQEWQATN
jgi:hypothetical protein